MTLRADPDVIAWVGRHVLPYEAKVRSALARARVPEADIDDLLQEAYCRLCGPWSTSRTRKAISSAPCAMC